MLRRFLHAWGNGGRWTILGWILATSFVWAVGGTVYVANHRLYDPFGDYPVQTVTAPREQVEQPDSFGTAQLEVPVVEVVGGHWPDVPVAGTKCLNEPTTVSGGRRWQSVEPPGFLGGENRGQSTRLAGCQPLKFSNPVPADVRAWVEAEAMAGKTLTLWRITGEESPVDGGVTKAWSTEIFGIRWTP